MIPENNFCRVFELPPRYPHDYCFGSNQPVMMWMVDWFNPWPEHRENDTWEEVKAELIPWLQQKRYVERGKQYLVLTDFGEAFTFEGE